MSSTPSDPDMLPRSLVEAWRADTSSASELRHGYARFIGRRPQRTMARRVAGFVLGGLVLGVGLAQAASLVPARWLARPEVALAPRAAPASEANAARPVSVKQLPAPVAAPAPAPAPAPMPAAAPPAPRVAPAAPAPRIQEQWQRAAAALRDHDFERAQAALLDVERSARGAERDAARLARSQLLASHGRNAQALALAEALAAGAQSALVRDKARALVARLAKNETTDRSAGRPPVAKQP